MTDAVAHRGELVDLHVGGPIALAALAQARAASANPIATRDQSAWIAWDGRLDNDGELRELLEPRARNAPHSELVLLAYERWGEACVERLLGDFAFVLWDARARQLFCARDVVGVRPFFYAIVGDTFFAGSEVRQLLVDESIPRDLDEEMIGEHLACAVTSKEQTLHRAIRRLPPAHSLVVRASGARLRRYWDATPVRPLARPAENAERLREVLTDAVRCRLRGVERAAIELSGGLDSSSIVALAAGVASDVGVHAETFSLVFPGLPCDESEYIAAVERVCALPSHRIVARPTRAIEYAERAQRYRDFPGHPNGLMAIPLLEHARDLGFSVCLSGVGGDDWLGGAPRASLGAYARFVASRAIRSIAPGWRSRTRVALPPWIVPAFARRIDLAERLRRRPVVPNLATIGQRATYECGMDPWQTHALEIEERESASYGIEPRYPFEDRRLIELALAMPTAELRRRDETKAVLRRALRGTLPELVRTRTSKVDFSSVFAQAFEEHGGERGFRSLRLAEAGFVDEARAREAAAVHARYAWPLSMLLGVEAFARVY